MKMRLGISLVVLVAGIFHIECHICDPGEKIPELPLRSRNIEAKGTSFLDDKLLPTGWYNAEVNGELYRMPDSTKMPKRHSCGTVDPIYIKGKHPDIHALNDTDIPIALCLRSAYGDCDSIKDIRIKKCNNTVQYYLLPAFHTHAAYCFDPPNIQGMDDKDFDLVPDNVKIVHVDVRPSLKYEGSPVKHPHIVIDCYANITGDTTGLLFVTSWNVHDEFFWTFTKEGHTTPLTEEELKVTGFDKNISCSVLLKKSELGKTTPLVSSEPYFAGVKVLTPQVQLPKSGSAFVEVMNTIPFGARFILNDENPPNVTRRVHMYYNQQSCSAQGVLTRAPEDGLSAGQESCGIEFKALYPNDKWVPETVTMEIKTKDVTLQDTGRYVLQLEVGNDDNHPIWNGHRLQDVSVIVLDDKSYAKKFCWSTGDPHLTTPDGHSYNVQSEADFILYRNKKHMIEVQIRTYPCNGNAIFCACAVAVRAGGDVFLVDFCKSEKGTVINTMTSCLDGGILDITRKDDQTFVINTPIGTKITITKHPWRRLYLNIMITMSPKDKYNTEGLCGTFDGNKNNDLMDPNGKIHGLTTRPDAFSRSWIVNGGNYLNHDHRCLKDVGRWDERHSLYCSCSCLHQGKACIDKVPYCSPSQYLSCPFYDSPIVKNECLKWTKRCDSNRRKRQAEIHPFMEMEPPVRHKRDVTRNITIEDAEAMCSQALNDPTIIGGIEEAADGFNITQAILDCVFDTFETNDDAFVQNYVGVLNTAVNVNLEKDPQFVETHKERVEEFVQQSCPANCSGNGKCSIEGKCNCTEGFSGSSCSISKEAQLNIYGVEGNGVCDLLHGDNCEEFEMFTMDLIDGFVCRIVEHKILLNGSTIELPAVVEDGDFIDAYNGECSLHSARKRRSVDEGATVIGSRYDMYISNDGKTFSNRAPLIVMDSVCQELINGSNGDYLLVLKEETCFINGQCYSANEENVYESCAKCIPETNPFQWTKDCVPINNNEQTNVNVLGIVLGTVIPVVLIVSAVVVIFVVTKYYGRQKRCVTPQSKRFGEL